MAISEQAAQGMSNAIRARVQAQDKRNPFLINVNDGRLVPNVGLLRKDPNYRVYFGAPDASLQARMHILATQGLGDRTPIVVEDSSTLFQNGAVVAATNAAVVAATDTRGPFDIHRASVTELVDFALANYNEQLDATTHKATLKAQVRALAKARGELVLTGNPSGSAEGELG